MPRLTGPTSEGIAALMPYFNSILGAVQEGGTTSQLWDAYKGAVEIAGGELGNPSILDMNYVAGYARAINTAEQAFTGAAPSEALSSEMWAWAPWTAGQTDPWLVDRYQLRYAASVEKEGEQRTIWGVTDWEGSLEGLTKGDIMDRAQASGQIAIDTDSDKILSQLGFEPGWALTGIQTVQIMRI